MSKAVLCIIKTPNTFEAFMEIFPFFRGLITVGLGEETLSMFFNKMDPQPRIYRKSSLSKTELKIASPPNGCSRPTRAKMALSSHFQMSLSLQLFQSASSYKGEAKWATADPRRRGTSRGTMASSDRAADLQTASVVFWGRLQYPSKGLRGQRYYNGETLPLSFTAFLRALLVQEQCWE